ncbi:hypothetical protein B296_00054218 [Ensete ventricosum]|uniref:Uncharacterized protein n=1 Tax=Ensete ventricosum TaxID=4639 RepID=A0A426WVG7_ENSVE|nr:hypothetical protein B296_00054218 [Ensete ventricosum]
MAGRPCKGLAVANHLYKHTACMWPPLPRRQHLSPPITATRLAKVKSMHRVDTFGNSPGVCRKLVEGIGSLPRWRKGVRQKKIETRRKIVGVRTMQWDLVKISLRDSLKESGSSLGTRREITEKKIGGLAARLPKYAGVMS